MGEAAANLELRTFAEQRHRDPAMVRDRAAGLLADPTQPAALVPVAEWVLGLALHELGECPGAADHLRHAARQARRLGDTETESLARASLAITLLSLGRTAEAQREIALADERAPPSARGRIDLLHGLVHQRVGELDLAFARYREALPRLRRDGDEHNVALVLLNRGTLVAYQGAVDAALADYAEVERLAGRRQLPVLVAMAAHNAGFALGRRGAVADALRAFDRAAAAYDELGRPPRLVAVLASDRCDVFLQVGLTDDARVTAEAAVAALGDVDAAHAAEARLLLAEACLAAGDLERAIVEASAAAEAFRSARRKPWAALAGYVGMRATIRATEDAASPRPELLARSLAAARELEQQGWRIEALHARTFVGRVALALGRPALAGRELARAQGARGRGPAGLRVQAWHAAALVRLAEDDRSGAKQALRRGLSVLDAYRARLGATELRVGAAAHGEDLARLGLRLALADRRPWEVLRWAERWRAGALRLLSARGPADAGVAGALADLREAEANLREGTLGGAPTPDLLDQVARRERTVRDLARRAAGSSAGARPSRSLDARALAARLGRRTLIELVNVDGHLHAVTVTAGRAQLRPVAPVARVDDEVGFLLFALRRRLAPGRGGRRQTGDVDAAARRVDDLLVAPLGLEPGRALVIVPTHPLHQLPWSALPSLSGRSVTVAPSAELWMDRACPAGAIDPGRVALVAGPDLPGAAAEVESLALRYPEGRVLRGPAATVDRVCSALAAADLAHVAAHGRFRSDSPLFSALRLADGALTIYDLERLAAVPSTFVLSACDTAVPKVARGDEVLGTATALVGLGVRSVLAPVLPVPDAATARFALAVHAALQAGAPPSAALARARHEVAESPDDRAIGAAFVCIGADEAAAAPPT